MGHGSSYVGIITGISLSSGLRLPQPGDPTDRFSVLFPIFYLKKKAESGFRNFEILLFYYLDQRLLTCGPRTPGGSRRLLRGSTTV
jgi:hypothetical protein